jgi:hypothetical protein
MTDDTTRQVEQPSDGAAATSAVTTPASTGAGASRLRWAVGLGVAGAAVAAIVVAVIVFGSRPTPPALTYIPAGAVMVAEVRPDLPGDQLQKFGNLLAHFPGFADQSTLPDKLDETFAQLFSQGSEGNVDYRADIKPWLSGPAFLALMPPSDSAADDPMAFRHGVASLTTTGTVTCETLFKDVAVTHETYQGADLLLSPDASAACVVDGQQALVGDPQSVRAALDAHAGSSSIDRDASYQEARASLQGDQLATIYIDGSGYLDIFEGMADGTPGMSGMLLTLRQAFPEWVIEGFRAEDDAVVVEVAAGPQAAPEPGASPATSLRPVPPAHASAILPFAPANTIAYVEGQGTGVALLNSIDQLRSMPMYTEVLGMLEGQVDPEELFGWIQDAGMIVAADGAGVGGGLVLIARDAAAATERAATLKGLIALGQLQGLSVDSTDSTVNGASVTTYTIGNLGSLIPPGSLPGSLGPGVEVPTDGTVTFSIATKDKAILIGAGEGFVSAALSVQPGTGLADQAGFKTAMSRAVPNSQATMYLAIRDIVTLIEPQIPAEKRAQWETEVKPYVAPFQAFSMTVSADPVSGSRGRFIVTVTNP